MESCSSSMNLLFGSSDDYGIFLLFHQPLGPDD